MEEDKWKVCLRCQYKRRVLDTSELRPGQHICIPGSHLTGYFRIFRKRIFLYTHHFIIKNVKKIEDRSRVKLQIFQFDKKKDDEKEKTQGGKSSGAKLYDEEKDFDLRYHELYIVENNTQSELNVEVECRMGKMLRKQADKCFPSYNPLLNNCEHVAIYCQYGKSWSNQSRDFFKGLISNLLELFDKIKDVIYEVIISHIERMIEVFDNSDIMGKCGLSVVQVLLQLFFNITITCLAFRDNKKGILCSKCFRTILIANWSVFVSSTAVSLLTLFVFGSMGLVLWQTIVLILLGGVFSYVLKKLIQKFTRHYSNVRWQKTLIADFNVLKVGDVVSLKYLSLDHKVIVTQVPNVPESTNFGTLQGIHYAFCGLCRSREIKEDKFSIDLRKRNTFKCEAINLEYFPPEEAIKRAKSRIGETKFHIFNNRSTHLCFWAKIKDPSLIRYNLDLDSESEVSYSETENEEMHNSTRDSLSTEGSPLDEQKGNDTREADRSSARVCIKEVHLYEEIEVGDAIEFEDWSRGIIIELTPSPFTQRQFSVDVIVRKLVGIYRSCRRERRNIDLKKERLYRHVFHPIHCSTREDIVAKACKSLKEGKRFRTNNSFLNECVIKD